MAIELKNTFTGKAAAASMAAMLVFMPTSVLAPNTVFAADNDRPAAEGTVVAEAGDALVIPAAVDAFAVLHEAYPAVQKDGYTYIRMDQTTGRDSSGALDVTALQMSYMNHADPANDPLIIVNYSYEGNDVSDKQSAFVQSLLAPLAERSERPIVYIDVVALRYNPEIGPEGVFLGNLMTDLQDNRLGPGGQTLPFNPETDNPVLPYGYIAVGGQKSGGFSFAIIEDTPGASKERAVAAILLGAVNTSNQQLASLPTSDRQSVAALTAE